MGLLKTVAAGLVGMTWVIGIVPAIAQTSPNAYLNALYRFLQDENPLAYQLATEVFTDQDNLEYAQVICAAYDEGYSVNQIINEFFAGAEVSSLSPEEQQILAAYLGALIPASALYHCPENWPTVQTFLDG